MASSADAEKPSTGQVGVEHGSRNHLATLVKQAWPRLRLLAPAVVGALLLTPFVLEHRLSSWMSDDPFFCYIHYILFFFPTPSPAGAYLERSIITLVFVAAGTGIAFLAVCGRIWIDGEGALAYSSEKSRAIGVCVTILFCFFSGCLSSYAPRLKGPCRALVFSTLWELTIQYEEISGRIFLSNFYPALIAMIVGIFCNFVVFPRSARHTSIEQLCHLFHGTQRLTAQTVDDFFRHHAITANADDSGVPAAPSNTATTSSSPMFGKLKAELQDLQSQLEANLDAAQYELSYARVSVDHLQVFLPLLREIRAWFSCSLVCLKDASFADSSQAPPEDPTADGLTDTPPPVLAFDDAIRSFSADISLSLFCLSRCVSKCAGSEASGKWQSAAGASEHRLDHSVVLDDPKSALSQQRIKLRASIRAFKAALSNAIKDSQSDIIGKTTQTLEANETRTIAADAGIQTDASEQSTPVDEPLLLSHLSRNDAYHISFLMISLLEVALLVDACFHAALSVAKTWDRNPRRKLRMPVAKWRYWLGRAHVDSSDGAGLADERIDALLHEDEPTSPSANAQPDDIDFFDSDYDNPMNGSSDLERTPSRASKSVAGVHSWITASIRGTRRLLRTRQALQHRVALSNAIRDVRHSRHIRFGIKLAAGIVLLTLPAWLAPGGARRWWLDKRGQWMAISYLFCLETSTGASIRTSFFRVLGTISGSLLGLVINEISRRNPYALAFLLTAATLPPSYLMLFTRFQGVGIVMGLTLPIVALIPREGDGESSAYVAWNRGYMIFLGIIAALLMNLFIWPIHARVELVRRVSSITAHLQSLYLSLSRQMLSGGLTSSPKSNGAFEKLEAGIGKRISQARGLVDIMRIEVSLKPKRTKVLSELLDHLEIIHELLMGLRRCREHGLRSLRQHAVVNVLELRQSLIAAVLLVLWTTGQALQTQTPLPQCLPSPRLALEELTEAVAEQVQTMVEGAEHTHRHLRDQHAVPDAFHALDSLNQKSILANVRRRNRKHRGLHSIHSYTPADGSRSGTSSPTPGQRSQPAGLSGADTPATKAKRSLDYAIFFVLAEHALLEQIVGSLERLLELCRSMVGEASFLRTEFVPNSSHGLDDMRTPGTSTPSARLRAVDLSDVEAVRPQEHSNPGNEATRSSRSAPHTSRLRNASPMNRPSQPSLLSSPPFMNESLAQ